MSVMIVFTCPTSGRDIPVGALPEGQDLATRRDDEVSIHVRSAGTSIRGSTETAA